MAAPKKKNKEWFNVMKQEGLDDMTLLSKLTNDQILQNIKERFENGIIYTYISDVLISVNPFRDLGLYQDSILQEYIGKSRIELPPHIFAIAEATYRAMKNEQENQCVIISGESGAGKTEAAKKIMQYIAAVSGTGNAELERVKSIILETNPLLEAFGNAKTLRNNNSSRFGKYFEIQFNREGNPVGGVITNYLLEKSRVVHQIEGERNFHIFYQFVKGASAQEKKDFGLKGPDGFYYLTRGRCLSIEGVDDVEEYKATRHAMNVIGITPDEQTQIFRLLAGILWLGNVDFVDTNEKSSIKDRKTLDFAAGLLGVPSGFLETALTIRHMETQHGAQRGTTYKVPLNYTQACATRDSLAKTIYDRLFDWLVNRVNAAMAVGAGDLLSIGVLDIYGFEVFQKNSFEQFCINYVNEKLQQIFIEFTLKLEQEEYVREGISWTPIEYFNNKIVCDLIEEKRPPGIFSVLDDVCRSVHSQKESADQAFLQRLSVCSSNAHFALRGAAFCVKHYAGDVIYEGEGFVEKNKDTFFKDLLETIQLSEIPLVAALFPEKIDPNSKKAPTTAGFKIQTSANALVKTLSKATPHYVRCLKPNDNKSAMEFNNERVMHQIRYLGLLDNIKVRRAGFAYRTTFQKFMNRYYLLSGRTSYAAQLIWKGDDVSGCRAILEDNHLSKEQYQIGKTKVFLRHPETLFMLEDLRENYWHNMVSRIKNAFRRWKSFKAECANRIKTAFRVWKEYRISCATLVQKVYREYRGAAPSFDLRMQNEANYVGKKERNRFSLISVRKFTGDYLNMKTQKALLAAMGDTAGREKVLFSSKAKAVVHPGMLRKNKLTPRFVVLTDQALYLIMLVQNKQKQLVEHRLERRIPINTIAAVSHSPFADNFVIVHVPTDFDAVIEVDFKTELVAWLKSKNPSMAVQFGDKLIYAKKKNKNNTLTFVKDDGFKKFNARKDPVYEGNKVIVASGLPPTSTPAVKATKASGGNSAVAASVGRSPAAASPARAATAQPTQSAQTGRALPPTAGRALPSAGAKAKPKCKALYDYDAVEQDELTLREGDVIEIVRKEGEWWEGTLKGKTGLFPANYVQEI